jgi:hypothetical protein
MTLEEKFNNFAKGQRDAMARYPHEDVERLLDIQRMMFYAGAIAMQSAYDGTVQTSTAVQYRTEIEAFKREMA